MSSCALCHQNEADKKGSHLVPHFLLKMIDNVDDRKGRDLELGFQLRAGRVQGYFGRSVQPEKLNNVFGERTDEENRNSRTNLVVDNFLCAGCEKRLAGIESSYAGTLKEYSEVSYTSTTQRLLGTLFWISIFWRMSASDTIEFKLNEIDEYHLRVILDGGMNSDEHDNYIERLGKEITGITYKLMRSKDFTVDHNGFLYFDNEIKNPYCALIGEYAVFLAVNKTVELSVGQSFLDLECHIKDAETNNCQQVEMILPVGHQVFTKAVDVLEIKYVKDFTEQLNNSLDLMHRNFIGDGTMDMEIKKQILNAITEDENPLGRKYTHEAITETTVKILLQHESYKSIVEQLFKI